MPWVKALHVFFVTGWFAGLFYLPRIFVNLAQVPQPGAERDRLLGMAARLERFSRILGACAIVFGVALWLGFGVGAGQGWLHAKLALVAVLLAFQALCARELRALRAGRQRHSHVWYRWFNEVPTVLLLGIVVLVVVKPF